jgi:hypothetical protein
MRRLFATDNGAKNAREPKSFRVFGNRECLLPSLLPSFTVHTNPQDLLLKAGTLADDAITSAKKNEHQEAIQSLAAATLYQNSVLNNLGAAIDKLHKALQKLQD